MKKNYNKNKNAQTKKTARRISILLLLLAICLALATLLVSGGLRYVTGSLGLVAFAFSSRVFAGSARYWLSGGFALLAAALGASGVTANNSLLIVVYWTLFVCAGLFAFGSFLPWKLSIFLMIGIAIGAMYFTGFNPIGGVHLWALIGLLFVILLLLISSLSWAYWVALIASIAYIVFIVMQVFNPVSVTFNANGGEYSDNSTVQVVSAKYGTNLNDFEVELPTRLGFEFARWNAYGVVVANATVRAMWTPLEPILSISGSEIGIVGVEAEYVLQIANAELLGEYEVQWAVFYNNGVTTYDAEEMFAFVPELAGEYMILAHVTTAADAVAVSDVISVVVFEQAPILNVLPASSFMQFGEQYSFFVDVPNFAQTAQSADVVLSIYKRSSPGQIVHSQSLSISPLTMQIVFVPLPYQQIVPGDYVAEISTTAGGKWTMDITISWFMSTEIKLGQEGNIGDIIVEMSRDNLEPVIFDVYLYGDANSNKNYYARTQDLVFTVGGAQKPVTFLKTNINHEAKTADIVVVYELVIEDIPSEEPFDIHLFATVSPTSAVSQTGVVIRIVD